MFQKEKGEHQNKTEGTSVINLILTLVFGIGLLRAICFAICVGVQATFVRSYLADAHVHRWEDGSLSIVIKIFFKHRVVGNLYQ